MTGGGRDELGRLLGLLLASCRDKLGRLLGLLLASCGKLGHRLLGLLLASCGELGHRQLGGRQRHWLEAASTSNRSFRPKIGRKKTTL
jgi:hypothetical protein